ncbi:MAG: hypothetical protein ACI93T_002382, partial [Porticoccaceae bacterium]
VVVWPRRLLENQFENFRIRICGLAILAGRHAACRSAQHAAHQTTKKNRSHISPHFVHDIGNRKELDNRDVITEFRIRASLFFRHQIESSLRTRTSAMRAWSNPLLSVTCIRIAVVRWSTLNRCRRQRWKLSATSMIVSHVSPSRISIE